MATVDTSLPAHPTGAAATLAASHSASHDLKLYGGWFCPFVQRSWIVLVEKGIAHQYIEINPYRKDPEFLALNPRGLVPTLAVPPADDGKAAAKPLYESSIICEYLDEAYGEDAAALLPRGRGEVYERARCRLWIEHIGSKIVPAFYKFLQHTPEKEYSIEEARGTFLGHVEAFVREMDGDERGPWFLGDRFSLVDVMLAPWAKRMFLIDHYKPGGVGIPATDGEDGGVWRRWGVWFDAITQRQSVRETWSDDEMYVEAYKRYAEDTTQSEVAKATRKGGKLP
ncbi:glutathione S-transferase [Xylaria bambusicola]|uniref:glutathione S-transferase n=1 Tax=Xylaria bambusicola TaxID=326684 RepID=UPI0020076C5F|nr:glutathione S-transferase [Xylaria bambusicola]KAI0513338.1 glutathione S-transferase [Xylaria bambusicola]